MIKFLFLFLVLLFSSLNGPKAGEIEKKADKGNYIGIGILDHKMGISLLAYTKDLYKNEEHEFYAGLGTLIAINKAGLGYKGYLLYGKYIDKDSA